MVFGPLVSVVKGRQAPEMDCLAAGATIAGMSALDYWIYSAGLILLAVAVLAA